jgi:hypothetical protein
LLYRLFCCAFLYISLCLLAPSWASASEADSSYGALANHKTWLKLVHYEPNNSFSSNWLSAVHSKDFFLDPNGREDPSRELIATLQAFQEPILDDADKHPQCRFPARYLWLKSQLAGHAAFQSQVNCKAFSSWSRGGSIDSISIVYATGFLGNPASYFGHTLLKFNFKDDIGLSRLLDVSVNYGAIVEKDAGPISYIAKSLTGGFDGGFSHIQYYFHNHTYGDEELRDLWEYQLKLSQSSVNFIVAHAWEMLGKRYTYYFFRHNCAYRMAELAEIVEGLSIIPDNVPWVVPQALIQNIGQTSFNAKSLLGEVTYRPSRQIRFYRRYNKLTPLQIKTLADIVDGKLLLNSQVFIALPIQDKYRTIDALLDYYQYIGNPIAKATLEIQQAYANALSARYQLPASNEEFSFAKSTSPHLGRPPGWLQIGAGRILNSGNLMTIRIRPAYYDALDSGPGHVENSSLVMSEAEMAVNKNKIFIKRFTLFAVESVNPGLSGLPGDTISGMKIRIGAEQLRLWCNNCLALRVQGDYGYGRQISKSFYGGIFAGVVAHNDRVGQGVGFSRVSTDFIIRTENNVRAKIGYEWRIPFKQSVKAYSVANAEIRWPVTENIDLRLYFEADRQRFLSIGLGKYW